MSGVELESLSFIEKKVFVVDFAHKIPFKFVRIYARVRFELQKNQFYIQRISLTKLSL